jgi:hypothetical protein
MQKMRRTGHVCKAARQPGYPLVGRLIAALLVCLCLLSIADVMDFLSAAGTLPVTIRTARMVTSPGLQSGAETAGVTAHSVLCKCLNCPGGKRCCCLNAHSAGESCAYRAVCDRGTTISIVATRVAKIAPAAIDLVAVRPMVGLMSGRFSRCATLAPSRSPAPEFQPPRLL